MQYVMAAEEAAIQQRSKLRWLWGPTAGLVMLGLMLFKIQPGWGTLSLMVAGLWMVLATVAYSVREGLVYMGSGLMGYGPDIRAAGLFAHYRGRLRLALLLCTHLFLALTGILVPLIFKLDAFDHGFLLLALQVVFVVGPLDACNSWIAHHGGDRPSMRQTLSLWVPALLCGQLCNWVFLDFMRVTLPGVVTAMNDIVGPICGGAYVLLLVGLHASHLRWTGQIDEANERADAAETARRLAEARLAVLQAQIEPHFLYNTLATVQYLIKGEPAAADFLLGQLIRYLRLAMPSMRQFSSTLGREFELTDAYLQIARLRMGGRLSVDLDLAIALEAQAFPPLVLQTLVENAIKHGVEPKPGAVRIRVWAEADAQSLSIHVQDDGVGFGAAPTQGGGTGLQNIRERLRGIYGDAARLTVTGQPQGGVLATVTVPRTES